jgi:2'-5' RNA ligase
VTHGATATGAATDRLFFALRPDPWTAARIHELAQKQRVAHRLMGRPLALERLHVTLCFLGDHRGLAPGLVDAADAAARDLRGMPFELTFDRVMSFRRSKGVAPLVLCRDQECAPLMQLRDSIAPGLARAGQLCHETREFTPHVTLLFDRTRVPEQQVPPVTWTVMEVLLVRSLIGRGKHEVLGRYPLG